jgi:arylsulfatase A-like enzyme
MSIGTGAAPADTRPNSVFLLVDGRRVHSTRLFTQQAEEFIRGDYGDGRQPFALSLSFKAAHGPWHEFDPAFEDAVAEADAPIPPTFEPSAFAALPEFIRRSRAGREGDRLRWDESQHRRFVANYYRLVAGVDAAVGKIRQILEDAGVADRTVIILTGDNGHFLQAHGLHGKWFMYEPSLSVPLIVYDPRLPEDRRGKVRDELVNSLDLAPTMLDLAGLEVPREGIGVMRGRSLLP